MTAPPENASPNDRALALGAAALVTIFAAVLRMSGSGDSLWLDELHTAWVVADDLRDIPARAKLGNQSALYFYLPRMASRVGSPSELSLRAPSLIAGIAIVPAIYFVVSAITKRPLAGLAAALISTVDFDFVWYSVEARVYSLVQLLSLVHLAICWRLLARPTLPLRIAAVLLAVVLFYLHYTAALLFAAELVAYGVLSVRRAWRPAYRPAQLALDCAIAALLCAPTAPHLVEIARVRENWLSIVDRVATTRALALPLAPLAAGAAALGALAILRRVRGPFSIDARMSVLALMTYAVPIAIAWAATEFAGAGLLLKRYVICASLAPPLAAGLLVGASGARYARAVAAIAVIATAVVLSSPAHDWLLTGAIAPHTREDWRSAVAHVVEADPYGRYPALVRSGFIEADDRYDSRLETEREYCLAPVRGVYRLGREQLTAPLPTSRVPKLENSLLAEIEHRRGAWLITRSRAGTAHRQAAVIVRQLPGGRKAWRVVNGFDGQNVTLLLIQSAPPAGESSSSGISSAGISTTWPLRQTTIGMPSFLWRRIASRMPSCIASSIGAPSSNIALTSTGGLRCIGKILGDSGPLPFQMHSRRRAALSERDQTQSIFEGIIVKAPCAR
jgi:hypothetical protein